MADKKKDHAGSAKRPTPEQYDSEFSLGIGKTLTCTYVGARKGIYSKPCSERTSSRRQCKLNSPCRAFLPLIVSQAAEKASEPEKICKCEAKDPTPSDKPAPSSTATPSSTVVHSGIPAPSSAPAKSQHDDTMPGESKEEESKENPPGKPSICTICGGLRSGNNRKNSDGGGDKDKGGKKGDGGAPGNAGASSGQAQVMTA